MSKISQKELLSEGFWDKFDPAPAYRQAKSLVKDVSKVVAPEIYDPISKGKDWLKNFKKNFKRAAMSVEEIVKEQLIENGYYPLTDDKGNEAQIRWGSKNSDDTKNGVISVGKVGFDESGNPYMAATFADPTRGGKRSNELVFTYDEDTKNVKITRAPYKMSGAIPTQQPRPQQNTSTTP